MSQSQSSKTSKQISAPSTILPIVIFFIACLFPVSINGFGVNYLFITFPIGILISGGVLIKPRAAVKFFLYGSAIVFSLSSLYQTQWWLYFDRRVVSYVLFLTMFSLCFVRISPRHIAAFKIAVLVAGLIFSVDALIIFVSLGADAQAFESKEIVGSQRYGFVYILAFWILWYDAHLIKSKTVKQILLIVLMLGIALTFSRASIVAFGVSCIVAAVQSLTARRISLLNVLRLLTYGFGFVFFSLFIVYQIAPIIFDFFSARLIDYITSGTSSVALNDPETSDGTRLFIWGNITNFILYNPITGSGFLGVWVLNLYDDFSGSSHSQYFDTLFRVGLLLFFGYVCLIFQMLRRFRKNDSGFFVGLSGILVYGVFHETFKESHGVFIFAMLLAIASQNLLRATFRFQSTI